MPLTARPGVLVPVSGVSVVRGAALVGGIAGGWRDWWLAAVVTRNRGLSTIAQEQATQWVFPGMDECTLGTP